MRSARCEGKHSTLSVSPSTSLRINSGPSLRRHCWWLVAGGWWLVATLASCGQEKVTDPPGGPPSVILAVEQLEVTDAPAPEGLELTPETGGLALAAAVPSCGAGIPWQANAAAEGELLRVYLFQPCGDRQAEGDARLDCFIAGEPAARCRRVELYLFNEGKGGFATLARVKRDLIP